MSSKPFSIITLPSTRPQRVPFPSLSLRTDPCLLSLHSFRGGQGNFVGGESLERSVSRERERAKGASVKNGRGGAGNWGVAEEGRDDLRTLEEEDDRVRHHYAESRAGFPQSYGKGASWILHCSYRLASSVEIEPDSPLRVVLLSLQAEPETSTPQVSARELHRTTLSSNHLAASPSSTRSQVEEERATSIPRLRLPALRKIEDEREERIDPSSRRRREEVGVGSWKG